MECPKCGYLGFDETPRCRNCSYDFALAQSGHGAALEEIDLRVDDAPAGSLASGEPDWAALGALDPVMPVTAGRPVFDMGDLDTLLRGTEAGGGAAPDTRLPSGEEPGRAPAPSEAGVNLDLSLDALLRESGSTTPQVVATPEVLTLPAVASFPVEPPARMPRPAERTWDETPPAPPPPPRTGPFLDVGALHDVPLVRLQQPRAPVAVRKTPMSPKLRAVSRVTPQEPAFDFLDQPEPASTAGDAGGPRADGRYAVPPAALESSPPLRRLAATAIDAVLFAGIDFTVVYLTFRIVGLSAAEWRVVPAWPLALFLVGMKLSYAAVFTALGGQTIGKMAAGIRVVSMDDRPVSAGTAVRRTLAALAAVATAGLGYLPGLLGRGRRALHDRASGTRVVLLPAA
jgi:uncharacterized RDD family membrane protein YckC